MGRDQICCPGDCFHEVFWFECLNEQESLSVRAPEYTWLCAGKLTRGGTRFRPSRIGALFVPRAAPCQRVCREPDSKFKISILANTSTTTKFTHLPTPPPNKALTSPPPLIYSKFAAKSFLSLSSLPESSLGHLELCESSLLVSPREQQQQNDAEEPACVNLVDSSHRSKPFHAVTRA